MSFLQCLGEETSFYQDSNWFLLSKFYKLTVGLAVAPSTYVLPPTPTSPVETFMQVPSTVSSGPVKVEPQPVILQAPPTPSPQPNEEEFALTLQMLATAYLQNKDMYNNLLQTTHVEGKYTSPFFSVL